MASLMRFALTPASISTPQAPAPTYTALPEEDE
jgi:hypothetical protein